MSVHNTPFGLAAQVEQLMKLPQSLCKQCGWSCRMVTFKGLMSHEEMVSASLDTSRAEDERRQIRDFLTLFQPYATQAEAMALAPAFVERVRETAERLKQEPDRVSFFHCRFLQADNRCGIYEDRPEGCRKYPIVHPNSIFHPGCGFEEQSRENWRQIEQILDTLGLDHTGQPKQG